MHTLNAAMSSHWWCIQLFSSTTETYVSEACIVLVCLHVVDNMGSFISHVLNYFQTIHSKRKKVLTCCISLCLCVCKAVKACVTTGSPLCVCVYVCVYLCVWMCKGVCVNLCTKLHVVSSWISPGSDLTRSRPRVMGHRSNHVAFVTFHLVCVPPLERWPRMTSRV